MKNILIKPIISEKSEILSESVGHYTFLVMKKSNKVEIKKAVESMYNVTVDSVNTVIMPAKRKVRNTRGGVQKGYKSSFKKAIVKLASGEEIDFFGDI